MTSSCWECFPYNPLTALPSLSLPPPYSVPFSLLFLGFNCFVCATIFANYSEFRSETEANICLIIDLSALACVNQRAKRVRARWHALLDFLMPKLESLGQMLCWQLFRKCKQIGQTVANTRLVDYVKVKCTHTHAHTHTQLGAVTC